jgi:hypothetical protein
MDPRSDAEPCSPFDPGGPVLQVYRRLKAGELIKAGLAQGKIHDFAVQLDLKAQALFVEHSSAIGTAGVVLKGFLTQSKLHHLGSSFFANKVRASAWKLQLKEYGKN